jgi:acetyl esterase/lipase
MLARDTEIKTRHATLTALKSVLSTKSLPEQRAMFDELGAAPAAEGCVVESLDLGGVPAEKITPAVATGGRVLLYLHGGGYVLGSLTSHRHMVSRFAVEARATAYHLDYRLAPEHPYPAALEDAMKAYRRILVSGVAPENLVVGGESAGGNLAAALLLKARETGVAQPAGLYLLSPWLDMTTTAESYDQVGERDPIVSRDDVRGFAAAFLGGNRDDHLTSPVRAELAGLPPTLIQVGTEEVLLSDSINFANRAALAGLDVTLRVWPGMPHAWPYLDPLAPAGIDAVDEAGQWMQRQLRNVRAEAA